jgi:hypothetical protein
VAGAQKKNIINILFNETNLHSDSESSFESH